MLLVMGVSLYTSRVILGALGNTDYGLNNVIAGVITLFSFINGSLGAATSRFLSFELGTNNQERLKKVFTNSFNIHVSFGILVLILGQTVGLWLVNNILNIPDDRMLACNIIYQFVILSSFLTITQVPLNAMIISHERMNIYAYIGISDAFVKLLIAYLVSITAFDKLITLGILNFIFALCMYLFYHLYCHRHFIEYKISFTFDKPILKEMLGYSTWSLIGSTAFMLKTQGINILLNIFFGPVVNAANAIAYQVNNAIISFTTNFTMALNPQMIKSYANGEHKRMNSLLFKGGRFSFYLLMLLCLPILFNTEFILQIWLTNVPEYAVIFTKLALILSMTESFTYTIGYAIQASGKIKYYQVIVCGILLLSFPISYILYKMNFPPYTALCVSIIIGLLALVIRLFFLRKILHIPISNYVRSVFVPCGITLLIALIAPYFSRKIFLYNWNGFIMQSLIVEFSVILSVYFIGITKSERYRIRKMVRNKIKKNI